MSGFRLVCLSVCLFFYVCLPLVTESSANGEAGWLFSNTLAPRWVCFLLHLEPTPFTAPWSQRSCPER